MIFFVLKNGLSSGSVFVSNLFKVYANKLPLLQPTESLLNGGDLKQLSPNFSEKCPSRTGLTQQLNWLTVGKMVVLEVIHCTCT